MSNTISVQQSSSRSDRWYLGIAIAMAALIYAVTLTYPFNNDNALYAYMADMLLHGGRLPYLGTWDQNFPGILLVHLVPLVLGIRSQFAFHVWDIALQLGGSWIIFRIVARVASARAALLAVVLSALYYVQQGLWMAGERDTYVTILLFGAIVLALSISGSARMKAILIALILGVIFLFRPTYGLFVPCFGLWLFLGDSATGLRSKFQNLVLFLLSSTVPTVIVLLIYTLAGGIHELWLSSIIYNLKVYGGKGEQFSFWDPVRFYAISVPFVLIGMWTLFSTGTRKFLLLWALLFGASLTSLIMLYRHSVYHYHPAMALFILVSAVGFDRAAAGFAALINTGKDAQRGMQFALLAIVMLFFGYQTVRGNTVQQVIRALVHGEIRSMQDMYAMYEGSPQFGEPVQTSVGEYLKQHAEPGDAAQMFGPYSYPQYFARMTTASRFQTLHAIAMRGASDSLQPFQQTWRKEYLADMQTKRPVYFIVCDAPEAFRQYYGGMLGHEILDRDFTSLNDWLQINYHYETRIGAFTLYRRN